MLSKGITYENLIKEFTEEFDRAGVLRAKVTKADIQNLVRGSGFFQAPSVFALQRLGLLDRGGDRPRNGEVRGR